MGIDQIKDYCLVCAGRDESEKIMSFSPIKLFSSNGIPPASGTMPTINGLTRLPILKMAAIALASHPAIHHFLMHSDSVIHHAPPLTF